MSTDSPFAIVLAFYETYRHVKLEEEDLRKVADKYAKRPQKILSALQKKYSLPFPTTVSLDRVRRLLALYPVPQCYADLIWAHVNKSSTDASSSAAVYEYEARLDINSTHFDASAALAAGRIIAPDTAVPHLENVSKFKVQMMHNSKPGGALLDYTLIDKAKSILAQIRPAHPFDSMATYAAGMNKVKKEGQGSGKGARKAAVGARDVQPQSPLAMLEHLMKNKVRAHIVVRRRGGIKGILLGYVHAFDRHMNLLMSDVDEVFAPNWKEVRVQATPDSSLPATVLIHEPSPCRRLTPSPLVTYTTTLTSTTDATLHPAPLLSGVFPADHQAAAEGEQQG